MFDALKQARRAGAAVKKAQQEQQAQPEPKVPTPPAPMAKADPLPLPRSSKSLAEFSEALSKDSVSDQMRRLEQATAALSGLSDVPRNKDQSERKLTIGTGIRLKGDISDCDSLLVEGKIEASVKADKVEIKEGGTIVGDAEIGIADISGRFEGSLTVTGHLIVRSTGRVSGRIRYQAIMVEAGGEISGDIQAKSPESDREATTPSQNSTASEAEDKQETKSQDRA